MAKRHRASLITASFHYLVKVTPNEDVPENPIEHPFRQDEFQRIISRISDLNPLNETDPDVIARIKSGRDLPFSGYELVPPSLHFGNFDGAYYGQQYRNNLLGLISADSLNLRPFNYLITRLGDGKILVGVTYNGQFGDYEGMKRCLIHLLGRGNYQIKSRTITSLSEELGEGNPTEIRLSYRNSGNRPERSGLFGQTGVIAIKSAEFGDGFQDEFTRVAERMRGNPAQRKRAIAELVRQGNVIELDDDDILGCTAIVREQGRSRTVYLLGSHGMATKFRLFVDVDGNGIPNREQVKGEMIRVMREKVTPLLA